MADKKVVLLYRRALQINKESVFTQVSSTSGKLIILFTFLVVSEISQL